MVLLLVYTDINCVHGTIASVRLYYFVHGTIASVRLY